MRLLTGIEWLEVEHLAGLQRSSVLQAVEHRLVDGVRSFGTRRQRGGKKMTSSDFTPRTQNGSPSVKFVLRQRAGLVGTEHVHAGELFDGDQLG